MAHSDPHITNLPSAASTLPLQMTSRLRFDQMVIWSNLRRDVIWSGSVLAAEGRLVMCGSHLKATISN